MATRNCLVKVIDALYDLACTTILFVDKSVLTSNKMTASQVWIPSNQERIISAAPNDDPESNVFDEERASRHRPSSSHTRMHANVGVANPHAHGHPLQSSRVLHRSAYDRSSGATGRMVSASRLPSDPVQSRPSRDGDAREIAIIRYAEYAELDIAAVRQLYPRRTVHHFTPENKRIVRC